MCRPDLRQARSVLIAFRIPEYENPVMLRFVELVQMHRLLNGNDGFASKQATADFKFNRGHAQLPF